jgi:uncharacterized protein with ParB-like and HNH nuclease domain
MKATETYFVKFLQGTQQFVIPIYQRTYSWTEKQCESLWHDILRVAQNEKIPSHFVGSIVYIEKTHFQVSGVSELLVIDGQQRLTTLSLLLLAIRKTLDEKGDGTEITKNKINNYFLFNNEESGEKRYKLLLTQSDKDTLINLEDNREPPKNYSKNIVNNLKFFQNQIAKSGVDLDLLYQGILKLMIVDISLNSQHDNPQLIFESLNSTGLELSQADLIRNYVLMDLEREKQEQIYKNYWFPMEESFGHSEGSEYFDRFMRDYLTIKTGQIPNIGEVYSSFKDFVLSKEKSADNLVSDIHYFSKFFIKLAFEKEIDKEINQIIQNINALKVDVAYPFLLEVLVDYDKNEITRDELLEIFLMVESYVFRRAICGIPTNSLNKTFANLASEINHDDYLESIKAAFNLKETYRQFPNDVEFRQQFIIKQVYNLKIIKYLLSKLENYERKEHVNVEDYTIEHIMPQNKNLSQEWRNELGENWIDIHDKYLHTLGNLTFTGYNSELSDKSFLEKRNMKGGFADSPIRLNSTLSSLEHWNKEEILKRANSIIDKAIEIWKFPKLPSEVLAKYTELEEDEEDLDENEIPKPEWEYRVTSASNEVKQDLDELISTIKKKFDCEVEPYWKWLFFYVQKPAERKNCFAILNCGKNTANAIFRINPETFKDSEHVRMVLGWFFPRGTERRMSITHDSIPEIMHYLEHSYSTTNILLKKRHEAAVKAWDTRKNESR